MEKASARRLFASGRCRAQLPNRQILVLGGCDGERARETPVEHSVLKLPANVIALDPVDEREVVFVPAIRLELHYHVERVRPSCHVSKCEVGRCAVIEIDATGGTLE